jgi:hypothetical protein
MRCESTRRFSATTIRYLADRLIHHPGELKEARCDLFGVKWNRNSS